jgi:hypothetical protein
MGKQTRLGSLVILALLAWPLQAPARAPMAVKSPQEVIEELFQQARPHLEAVLAGRLEKLPRFQVTTAEHLRKSPDKDLEVQIRRQFPHLRGETLSRAVTAAQKASISATLARHQAGSEIIHVFPDHLSAISRWNAGIASANSPQFLQLAMVHETVRFMLDQRYDLARRRKECLDAEELQALEACVAGRAQWVTRAVAKKLGSEKLFPLLAQRYLHVPDVAPDAALRLVSQSVVREQHWACHHGLSFCQYLADQGLDDVEKAIFTRPPRQARWITRPQLYWRAHQNGRPDLIAVMSKLQNAVPQAEWVGAQQSWTPAMVSQVAGMLNEKARAEKVLESWDEGRTLVWSHKTDRGAQVALSVVRYETSAGARAYFGFAADLQRKRDETPGVCGPTLKVLESKSAALKMPDVEDAMRTDKRIQLGAGNQPIPVHMVLARAGELVVECSWHGFSAEPAWAERMIAAALKAAR